MSAESYNAVKPGSSGRSLACAIVLLGGALALAASFSRARGREILADRIAVPEWNLSFRPPKRFVQSDVVRSLGGQVLPFYAVVKSGGHAILAMRRFPLNPGDDPASVCRQLLRHQTEQAATAVPTMPWMPTIAPLGAFEGVEMMTPDQSTLVRVAFLDESIGLAMELYVDGSAIDEPLHDAFDRTCRSIEVAGR
ncbi:MAG: hypothetical protein IID42_07335 [Planctomycetes bacterium]|nr:hypothetical protein [Planctomycetota bacterium]